MHITTHPRLMKQQKDNKQDTSFFSIYLDFVHALDLLIQLREYLPPDSVDETGQLQRLKLRTHLLIGKHCENMRSVPKESEAIL